MVHGFQLGDKTQNTHRLNHQIWIVLVQILTKPKEYATHSVINGKKQMVPNLVFFSNQVLFGLYRNLNSTEVDRSMGKLQPNGLEFILLLFFGSQPRC